MKAVAVLYDYVAQTVDELSVVEGEELVLTEVGTSFGEGWAEVRLFVFVFAVAWFVVADEVVQVIKEGRVGIVPGSYVSCCRRLLVVRS